MSVVGDIRKRLAKWGEAWMDRNACKENGKPPTLPEPERRPDLEERLREETRRYEQDLRELAKG